MILQNLKKVAFSTKITKIETLKPIAKGMSSTQKNQLQRLQQLKQMTEIKKKQMIYQSLNSFPSDSIQTISQRFKKLKKNLMNRRIYVPNRADELSKIDQQMIKLKQFHSLESVNSLQPHRTRSDTKQQIIEYQLQNAKMQHYIGLLSNDTFIVSVLMILIILVSMTEYYFFIYNSPKVRKFPSTEL